jgi:hypothetical protein
MNKSIFLKNIFLKRIDKIGRKNLQKKKIVFENIRGENRFC